MKWLSRIIVLTLFIFFFVLALKNTQEIVLYFFGGYELRGSLVLIMLCFFIGGCFLGVLAMIPSAFRNRRELARQRKKITELEHAQKTWQETNVIASTDSLSDTSIE